MGEGRPYGRPPHLPHHRSAATARIGLRGGTRVPSMRVSLNQESPQMSPEQLTTDYARIEKAIRFLDRERAAAPSLADVAAHVGLSEAHFQKLFTRWAGISPKRFLQHRTAEVVKRLLREERPMLDVTYEAGLSGPG